MTLTIELPWPDAPLWPNRRDHFMVKARAAAEQKQEAFILTRNAGGTLYPVPAKVPVKLIFHAPNSHRRDLDNAQAAMKHALDGIAKALSVDDKIFRPVSDWGEPKSPRGGVTVVVGEP